MSLRTFRLAALFLVSLASVATFAAPFAYVANQGSNTVTVLDSANNRIVRQLPTGAEPSGVAITPDGTWAYISRYGSNVVEAYDLRLQDVGTVTAVPISGAMAVIPVGQGPALPAINPAGTLVFVANSQSHSISVIDIASNTVTATLPLGATVTNPRSVVFSPNGATAYVATSEGSQGSAVTVIDVASLSVTATHGLNLTSPPFAASPFVMHPSGNTLYSVRTGIAANNQVFAIDTGTFAVTATQYTGTFPAGLAIDAVYNRAYVPVFTGNFVGIFELGTLAGPAPTFEVINPLSIAVNPAGTRVYLGSGGVSGQPDQVKAVDTASLTTVQSISTGSQPRSIAFGPDPVRLANMSTRGRVLRGNDVMITGFIVGGTESKMVAVTVAGPSLMGAGIQGPLANPKLTLVRTSDNTVYASNDDWQSDGNAAKLQEYGYAPAHPQEAAVMRHLAPGAYTVIVEGVNGSLGVALVGVYEAEYPNPPLLNLSTRGQVQTGEGVMIAGFIVQGTGAQNVVLTVAGPSLAAAGVADSLADPQVTIIRASDGVVIASNDNWQSQNNPGDVALIQNAGFAPAHPNEAAVYLTLPPGAYTAIVQGVGNTMGVGLVGVYRAP